MATCHLVATKWQALEHSRERMASNLPNCLGQHDKTAMIKNADRTNEPALSNRTLRIDEQPTGPQAA